MEKITATVPVTAPPSWATQQRLLLQTLEQSAHPFWDTYCREDGELHWDDSFGGGSPDDFYEAFFNWPLVYLMGGGDHLLDMAHRGWEGVTRLLTRCGTVHKEYAVAEDQFHQSESDIFFYHLCMADPGNAALATRARRFAGFYLNEDPEAINYDPEHKIILSPRNGSGGPRYGFAGAEPGPWRADERYRLPTYELPDVQTWEDTLDDDKAMRLGDVMHGRWDKGDAIANLGVTSLATNAFLLTGEEKYRDWVVEYTDAWLERARANDWMIPDNVGHSGRVGEYMNGKWHGNLYGWTFPHGWYNIQMTMTDAAANAYLLTRDDRYLELPRRQLDRILELGETRDIRYQHMSLREHWIGQFTAMGERTEACSCRTATATPDGSTGSPHHPFSRQRCGICRWLTRIGSASSACARLKLTTGTMSYRFATRRTAATSRRGCVTWPVTTPTTRSAPCRRVTSRWRGASP